MTDKLWAAAWGCFITGAVILFSKLAVRKLNKNQPSSAPRGKKIAVLIPARDESAVISGLLESLAAQSYKVDFSDVYVIVERRDDPTVKLAREYGAQVVVRKNIADRQRKGYALDDAVEKILRAGKHYGAYFVFDADNTLDKRYLERMMKVYEKGYDMGVGRRRTQNLDTAVAVGSGLIFTVVNGLVNRSRTRHGMNCVVSGTGYFITGKVLLDLGGFPFYSLTEDYELSLYATMAGLSVRYEPAAVFYDEQPRGYGQYLRQRTRWVKGYFEARRKFRGRMRAGLFGHNWVSTYEVLIGIYDLLLIVIGIFLMALAVILSGDLVIFNLCGLALTVYVALAIFTWGLLAIEKYKISLARELLVIAVNPLLLLSYVLCLVIAIFSPKLEWKPIQHGE